MEPTQIEHPWRASLRTAFQTALAALFALIAFLPLVAEFVREVAPDSPLVGVILGVVAVLSSLALLITRAMALPQVNKLLTRLGLGPVSKEEA